MKVLDLFCGAGGATVGMSLLGMDIVGVDHELDACLTHAAAGHATIRADLTKPAPVLGDFDGVWASPPCTAFSMAGKGEGREVADELVAAIHREDWSPWDSDPSVWLILPTMQAILDVAPRWVAMENVPATQPVMDACARVLERHGYRATTVVLSSERFGVAQTRKRCFLIANRDGFTLPEPTHQGYTHGEPAQGSESLFGTVLPWVSMAEALGWTGFRAGFPRQDDTGTSNDGYRDRDWRDDNEPAFGLTEKARSWVLDRRTISRGPGGTRVPTVPVPVTSPSPSLTVSGVDGQFVWRSDPMDNACRRELDQPAGTIKHGHEPPSCVYDRPSTVLQGDPRVAKPVHVGTPEKPRQFSDCIRLTIGEAARLQAFPHDHPWRGSRTSQFRQIGNAVPPVMGAVVAASAAGLDWRAPVAAYLTDLYAAPVTREAAA